MTPTLSCFLYAALAPATAAAQPAPAQPAPAQPATATPAGPDTQALPSATPQTPGANPTSGPATPAPGPGTEPPTQMGSTTFTAPAATPTPKAAPDASAAAPQDSSLQMGTAGARAAGLAPPGVSSSFIDTRLTWTFGDDDFLNKTGVLVPLSPSFNIGDRPQYRLFFDNLNSRFAGRENITHLVMYKKMPGFLPNLTTEAALVLRFDLAALASGSGNLNSALYDSGSYIRAFYKTHAVEDARGVQRDAGLSAVFFPLDTDRMRLGYLYDISWGGTDARINESIFPRLQGASPGFKLQYDVPDRFYAFVGFKTATIVQPVQILNSSAQSDIETVRVGESNYGFLAGGGYDFTRFLRLDAGAGYFQQGKFDRDLVRGKSVYTFGASARLVAHHNMPVPQSVDFRLYRNDSAAPMVLFAPVKYDRGELSWSVSAEASLLHQNLEDFSTAGATTLQAAKAAALQGVVAYGFNRISATVIYRDLNFVLRNVPGFMPFRSLPDSAKTDPELFGAASYSYYFDGPRLTPELGAGIQMPSTFSSVFADGVTPAGNTVVIRRQGDESILPLRAERRPIIQARLSLKWNMSDILSAVLWTQYVNDNNGTFIVRDPGEGTASLRQFQKAHRLGAGIALQARF